MDVAAIDVLDGDVTATLATSPEVQSAELSTSDADSFDIVSPELALVDPELREKARARLPSYEQLAERRRSDESALEVRADTIPLISPELALVDPVLAEWARARLPDPPYTQSARDDVQAAIPASPRAEVEWTPARARDRRTRRVMRGPARAASRAVALVVLAAAGFFTSGALDTQSGSAPVAFSVAAETAAAGRPKAASKGHTTNSPSVPPQPAGTAKRPTPTKSQLAPRAFGWVAVAGAASYEVEFVRAGRRIFAGKTIQPRLTLSTRWTYRAHKFRLVPGLYRWNVWPIYNSASGSRRGRPVVQSRLTVAG